MPFKMLQPANMRGQDVRKVPGKRQRTDVESDRVDICIYKVTDQAGNCWNKFEGVSDPLWQVPHVAALLL